MSRRRSSFSGRAGFARRGLSLTSRGALCLSVVLAACSPGDADDGSGPVGKAERPTATPPARILSLVPSATQTLLALGCGHLLVGRTAFDTMRALAELPSVGGGLMPNLEELTALEPDLVILFAGRSDTSTPAALKRLQIPFLAVRPDRIQDVLDLVQTLGEVTGRVAEADRLVREIQTDLAEVQTRVRGHPPLKVAYLLGGDPPWVAGPGTYLDELLTVAGGRNAFEDLSQPYGPVSVEELIARAPDVVLAHEDGEAALPPLPLPIRRVSADVELPGPGLGRAARELARVLHPELFR